MASVVPQCIRIGLLSCAVLAAPGIGRAQAPNGGPQSRELLGQIVRPDGTPFTEGALVKVENDRGGIGAEVSSDSRGKFDVIGLQRSWYTVTVHASGFRDATTDVDLDTLPRANIRIALRALTSSTPAAPSTAGPSPTVSVSDLNVPEAARSEFEKGRSLLLDKHKPEDSVKAFLKAIQIAPTYPQAHFLLGTAYLDTGKWTDAEASLRKAISLDDKLDAAYLALGACLIEQKKFAEAEQPLVRGLELLPSDSRGHYDLGRTYYTLNRPQESEVEARKAASLDPNFPEAHILLGNVLLRLREGPEALAEFQEYLRLAPQGSFAGPAQELVKKLQASLPETQ